MYLVVYGGGSGWDCGGDMRWVGGDVRLVGGVSVIVIYFYDVYGGVNILGLIKYIVFKIE